MKITLTQLITLPFFCFIHSWSAAQSLNIPLQIKGKLSADSKADVSYVTLGLYHARDTAFVKGTLTNEAGEFTFENLAAGTYLIAVNSFSFKKVYSAPHVLDAQHAVLILDNVPLISEVRDLKQVEITSSKPLIERRNNKIIVNVANSPLSAGNSALEILSRAPGVTVDNAGNISLKGKAGITVLIDDKLTYLSAEQLTNLLRTINGNTIQSIELLSNPSARYDATGSGGIINIKLKKSDAYGTNGTVTLGAGYGTYYKSNAGINFNHRGKSINVFGSYNYSNNKEYEDLTLKRSTGAGTDNTYFNQFEKQANVRQNNSYKAGIDYNIGANNVLGAMVSGYANYGSVRDQITTLIGHSPLATDSSISAQNPGKNQYKNQTYNLNYKSKLDTSGQELTTSLDYSRVRSQEQIIYNNYFYDAGGNALRQPLIFLNSTPSKIDIWAAQLDYTRPFNTKTKLETGLKSSYVKTDNDLRSENLISGDWINDVSKSNQFSYKEQVYAAYANLHKELASTTFQLGLRTEFTSSQGNLITLQNTVNRHYLDFFPNVSINQSLNKDHEIGFSYSRRIDRPSYQSLNPFIYYADLYTRSQGNPWLKPQYANSFELSYSYKKSTTLTFGYTRTNDVMTTVLLTDTSTKTLLLTEQNLASRSTLSMNINKPVALTNWWNTSNDATLYYSNFSSPNLMGIPFRSGKLTLLINTVQSFAINSSLNAEVSGNYASSQVYGTYIAKPFYGIDLGLSKTFAGKKASVKLAANDIFNQRIIKIRSAVTNQDYQLSQKQESRIFRATFTYNFGSRPAKAERQHSNSSEAEQSRVRSGN